MNPSDVATKIAQALLTVTIVSGIYLGLFQAMVTLSSTAAWRVL